MIIDKNIKKFFNDFTENFHFNICMRMLMESLDEDERFDYPFFSGLTGDAFTQIYNRNLCVDSPSNDMFSPQLVDKVFSAIGYKYIFVSEKDLHENGQYWIDKVIESLDNGRMVILSGFVNFGLICGYEQDNLFHVYGRYEEKYLTSIKSLDNTKFLIFIGEKVKIPDIIKIYADMVMQIPSCFKKLPENGYYFGIDAFEKWHETLLNDTLYENNNFDVWNIHAAPLTIESENNGCDYEIGFARVLLKRFVASFDDLEYQDLIKNLILIYDKIGAESSSIFHDKLAHNVIEENFCEREIREKIARKIFNIAEYHKEILKLNWMYSSIL